MKDLANQKCIPCEVGGDPMGKNEVGLYSKDVPKWNVSDDGKKISRTFSFKDFVEAMAFVNKVAEIANKEEHHPDISISYNKVTLELSTHAVKGLTPNDFIVAAKIDRIG